MVKTQQARRHSRRRLVRGHADVSSALQYMLEDATADFTHRAKRNVQLRVTFQQFADRRRKQQVNCTSEACNHDLSRNESSRMVQLVLQVIQRLICAAKCRLHRFQKGARRTTEAAATNQFRTAALLQRQNCLRDSRLRQAEFQRDCRKAGPLA